MVNKILEENSPKRLRIIKKGLFKSLKSEFCWHLYGIIHRTSKNYAEAAKCYQRAITLDPSNIQVLKDIATLQLQIRDHDGHIESRIKILQEKSAVPANWLNLAIGYHLVLLNKKE